MRGGGQDKCVEKPVIPVDGLWIKQPDREKRLLIHKIYSGFQLRSTLRRDVKSRVISLLVLLR
jgi:hypothetical protein